MIRKEDPVDLVRQESDLIMNTSEDLKSFNIDKCNERFENFYTLHNLEVERLKDHKNLSSIAI